MFNHEIHIKCVIGPVTSKIADHPDRIKANFHSELDSMKNSKFVTVFVFLVPIKNFILLMKSDCTIRKIREYDFMS